MFTVFIQCHFTNERVDLCLLLYCNNEIKNLIAAATLNYYVDTMNFYQFKYQSPNQIQIFSNL